MRPIGNALRARAAARSWHRAPARGFGTSLVLAVLMLGAAAQLATLIGASPLVGALLPACYAVAGALAFLPGASRVDGLVRRGLPLVAVPLGLSLIVRADATAWPLVVLHLAAFALASAACHRAVAARRPVTGDEGYALAAVAGVLLGLLAAVSLVPRLFDGVSLYPLALVVAPAIRREKTRATDRSIWDFVVPAAVGVVARVAVLASSQAAVSGPVAVLALALPAILCFSARRSSPRFAAALAMLLVAGGAFGADRDGPILAAMWAIFGAYRLRFVVDRRWGTAARPERRRAPAGRTPSGATPAVA